MTAITTIGLAVPRWRFGSPQSSELDEQDLHLGGTAICAPSSIVDVLALGMGTFAFRLDEKQSFGERDGSKNHLLAAPATSAAAQLNGALSHILPRNWRIYAMLILTPITAGHGRRDTSSDGVAGSVATPLPLDFAYLGRGLQWLQQLWVKDWLSLSSPPRSGCEGRPYTIVGPVRDRRHWAWGMA